MKDFRYCDTGRVFTALFLICAFALAGCGGGGKETLMLEEFREGHEKADTKGLDGREIDGSGGGAGRPREEEKVVVYVCGAVNFPGVYTLKAGSRMYEALQAAGGISSDGCGDILSQASLLKDGERIYVPTKEEASEKDFAPAGFGEAAKVNINTASKDELMTLPGIGASRAEGIISYREKHGGFEDIEELKNVDGIKEGIFGRLKDKITV